MYFIRSCYIRQGKAENEDKLKQVAYLAAIKNIRHFSTTVMRCCVNSHGLRATAFVYQLIDLITSPSHGITSQRELPF